MHVFVKFVVQKERKGHHFFSPCKRKTHHAQMPSYLREFPQNVLLLKLDIILYTVSETRKLVNLFD